MDNYYYVKLAIARIKGALMRKGYCSQLINKDINELTENEIRSIFQIANEQNIELYYFKKTGSLLPRVSKIIGILRGLYFESLLDVGSGRGAFLIPFMDAFPYVNVKSIDILDKRVEMLEDMQKGGLDCFFVEKKSICDISKEEKIVDVVTMLEVLEHIPDYERAIENAVKLAKKYVIVSVPSHEDNNEEHINLLAKEILTKCFNAQGVKKISFDEVHEHLIAIIQI